MTDPTATAEGAEGACAKDAASRCSRAGWAAPTSTAGAGDPRRRRTSRRSPIPIRPRASSRTCGATAYNLRGLYETPSCGGRSVQRCRRTAHRGHPRVRAGCGPHPAHRTRIEAGAGRVRHSDGRHAIAASRRRGGRAASAIGYPVVLKLHSETITHKTDVGGVAAEPARAPTRCASAYRRDRGSRHGTSRSRALPRRDRSADGRRSRATN